MFTIDELLPTQPIVIPTVVKTNRKPFKHNYAVTIEGTGNTVSSSSIDNILEIEKQKNIKDTWNKLDKTMKIQKLNIYATKYCTINKSDLYDDSILSAFFKNALEHNKLQKKKDVIYDQETHEIISIPSLCFKSNEVFLNNLDRKRISTLKSLTPKRIVG